jgi:hypothetical protein
MKKWKNIMFWYSNIKVVSISMCVCELARRMLNTYFVYENRV